MSSQFLRALESLKDQAKDALWAVSSCVCQQSAKVKINGRTFKIVKVLGEGGFSFVYLAQDETSGRQFALKKIRCPTGSAAVKEALREVEAYRRFRHPNIIRILDSAVVQDRDEEGKIVYLFLPLYKRGNLQDVINRNLVNGDHFPEREMVRLFRGTCEAVRAMHTYRAPVPSAPSASASVPNGNGAAHPPAAARTLGLGMEHEQDDDDQMLPQPEGDTHGGYSYDGASVPLLPRSSRSRQQKLRMQDRDDDEDEGLGGESNGDVDGNVVFDGDSELRRMQVEQPAEGVEDGKTEIVPYAHRDIKPGNVMLTDDGQTPILMDFGSTIKARIKIETRSQALAQQDLAAEQSTMPYRAPELFDVKTGCTLDEKVDIWSLGCTLYALAYSHSPFETAQTTEQGGSIAMSVLNGAYKHPANAGSIYSEGLRGLIDFMLKVEPSERPDIHQVLERTDVVLRSLS